MHYFYYKQDFLTFSIVMPTISRRAFRIGEGEMLRYIFGESKQFRDIEKNIIFCHIYILFRHIYILIIYFSRNIIIV